MFSHEAESEGLSKSVHDDEEYVNMKVTGNADDNWATNARMNPEKKLAVLVLMVVVKMWTGKVNTNRFPKLDLQSPFTRRAEVIQQQFDNLMSRQQKPTKKEQQDAHIGMDESNKTRSWKLTKNCHSIRSVN